LRADRLAASKLIDRYKHVVAFCSVGGVDLADWMVRQGLALDWPKYSKGDYAAAQREVSIGLQIWLFTIRPVEVKHFQASFGI
jgi:hypothetical protein